ncbi:MAG TPA: mannosyltransferase family protein [Solirubrobacteraceae bacterium]|nr:mannosyltransferase family protein [Solirubrobacteraceae bacterium]
MTPDTAELAIADPARELPGPPGASAAAQAGVGRAAADVRGQGIAGLRQRLGAAVDSLGPARAAAVRDSWSALWRSRLLVWVVGVATLATYGFGPVRHAFIPPGLTRGFGWLGDLLAAPAARWDASWYLVIAHYGYRPDLGAFTASRDAFFPLYPLGLRGLGSLGLPLIAGGVLISLLALALALYGIHRLTSLELATLTRRGATPSRPAAGAPGETDVARLAVMLTAFAPMAFFLSAVYSEALYLALSVGLFYAARRGRFALVGVIAALAGATRSTGIVLLLPALILYLYGPREDRAPDRPHARGLSLRYRLRRDALWLALAPVGLLLYLAYLGLAGGDPLAPFHAQDVWGRHFAGPYAGVWDGLRAAFEGARQLLSMQQTHAYFATGGESPFVAAQHNLLLIAFLLAALVATAGVLRRLPLAYGAYVIAALALPLSYPVTSQPLMSLPRFEVVLFPLNIWFASWLASHPRLRRPVLACSGLAMAFFLAQFATWHWVA